MKAWILVINKGQLLARSKEDNLWRQIRPTYLYEVTFGLCTPPNGDLRPNWESGPIDLQNVNVYGYYDETGEPCEPDTETPKSNNSSEVAT